MNKKAMLFCGPLIFIAFILYPGSIVGPEADKVIGIALWMILWWVTEAASISVTALIPLTFYPLFGVMSVKDVAANYGHPIVFLFFGGFVMALALEKANLHKRIALGIIKRIGTSPDKVILGFMIATAFLSMWISNTATTVVMLPIAYSVIQLLVNDEDGFTKNDKNFALSIMLGPNKLANFTESTKSIDEEIKKLGTWSVDEKLVVCIFMIAISLWVAKNYLNDVFPELNLSDTTISMLAAFACFTVMVKNNMLLAWEDTKKLPWGIIILFGGGLALASALSGVGIIKMIGDLVSENKALSVFAVSAILISVMLFMTELMSNVALVAIFAPMIAGVATGLGINILHLLIPIAMASSCAFMLPMSTRAFRPLNDMDAGRPEGTRNEPRTKT